MRCGRHTTQLASSQLARDISFFVQGEVKPSEGWFHKMELSVPEVVCLTQVIISHFVRPCAIILPRWLPLPSMTSRLQQKSFAESVISPLPLPPKDLATMHCRLREPAFVLCIELLQYFGRHFISGRSPRFLSWATAASFRFLLCPALPYIFSRS